MWIFSPLFYFLQVPTRFNSRRNKVETLLLLLLVPCSYTDWGGSVLNNRWTSSETCAYLHSISKALHEAIWLSFFCFFDLDYSVLCGCACCNFKVRRKLLEYRVLDTLLQICCRTPTLRQRILWEHQRKSNRSNWKRRTGKKVARSFWIAVQVVVCCWSLNSYPHC